MFAVPTNRASELIAKNLPLQAVITEEGRLAQLVEQRLQASGRSFPTFSSYVARGPLEVKVHLRDDLTAKLPQTYVQRLLDRCSWTLPPLSESGDAVVGIRAFTFPLPCDLTAPDNRLLADTKIKGNCYFDSTAPGFRSMTLPKPQELWKSGQPHILYVIPQGGGLEYEPNTYTPCGVMLLPRAEREFLMSSLSFMDGLPTSLPLGFGEHLSLKSNNGSRLGFVILAVPPSNVSRLYNSFLEGWSEITRAIFSRDGRSHHPAVLDSLAQNVFRAGLLHGSLVRDYHLKGFRVGTPHFGNVSPMMVGRNRNPQKPIMYAFDLDSAHLVEELHSGARLPYAMLDMYWSLTYIDLLGQQPKDSDNDVPSIRRFAKELQAAGQSIDEWRSLMLAGWVNGYMYPVESESSGPISINSLIVLEEIKAKGGPVTELISRRLAAAGQLSVGDPVD